jgi:hypothetical protein
MRSEPDIRAWFYIKLSEKRHNSVCSGGSESIHYYSFSMIKCLIFLAVPAVLSPLVILVGPLLVGSSPTGESSPEGESSRGVGGARKVAEGGRGNSSLQPTATPSQIRLGGRLKAFQILGLVTLQGKSHQCIPLLGIARPRSQFLCVCERLTYSQDQSTYFPAAELGRPILEIYKSLIDV